MHERDNTSSAVETSRHKKQVTTEVSYMRAENSIRIFILKASVKITLGLTPPKN